MKALKAEKPTKGRARRKPVTRDSTLTEFRRRDLGDDIRASGAAMVGRPTERAKASKSTSIVLDPALIEKLRRKGKRRGLGYQTMLKLIVHEHIDEY